MNQEVLLDIMSASRYHGYTIEDFKEKYEITSHEDFVELVKNLNAMEEACVIVRDAQERYVLAEKAGYHTGILRINPKGFGFVETGETSFYVNKSNFNFALDGDKVFVKTWATFDQSS
ncbi:MAG: ribonuclease R, partial [Erysipelotrichaceae bacterium]